MNGKYEDKWDRGSLGEELLCMQVEENNASKTRMVYIKVDEKTNLISKH